MTPFFGGDTLGDIRVFVSAAAVQGEHKTGHLRPRKALLTPPKKVFRRVSTSIEPPREAVPARS